MKTFSHLWQYLTKFFLESKMFLTKVVEKIKTHILCSIIFFRKSHLLWDNVENMVEPERPHMTMAHALCMLGKSTMSKHSTRQRAIEPTHAHTSMRARTRTHKNM